MIKYIHFLCLAFIAIIFSSCSHVYAPALYHQDMAYMPKPASFDTAKSATYISGGLNFHSNGNYEDDLVSAQFNLSEGHRFKNFNLAYGVFGVAGDYENSSIDKGDANYFTDKFYGAVGARISGNFFTTTRKADIRFLGFEAAYSHEFGDYHDFRRQILTNPDYHSDPRTDLLTVGLTSEVLFHKGSNNNFQHGVQLFLGTTFGRNILNEVAYNDDDDNTLTTRIFRNVFPRASYFVKYNHLFGTVEVSSGVMVRVGASF